MACRGVLFHADFIVNYVCKAELNSTVVVNKAFHVLPKYYTIP